MAETATRVEPARTAAGDLVVVLLAWLVTLVASDLPDIAWRAVRGGAPAGMAGGRIVALAALTALCLAARRVRPLWQYGLMLLVCTAPPRCPRLSEAPRGGGRCFRRRGRRSRSCGSARRCAILVLPPR